jgi:hypothetical protein
MMISSTQQAFDILDNTGQFEGIPFEAIEYLYDASPSEEIRQQVYNRLKHGLKEGRPAEVVLWYAIVAENYLSTEPIKDILAFYGLTDYEYLDALDEQGAYLLEAIAIKYPDQTAEIILPVLEEYTKKGLNVSYFYWYDILLYIDLEKYGRQVLDIFVHEKDWISKELLYVRLKHMEKDKQLPETFLERFKEVSKEIDKEIEMRHFEDFSSVYESRKSLGWKEYYQDMESEFENPFPANESSDKEPHSYTNPPKPFAEVRQSEKIGRNDPCPCGSGKKYKKCCGK